MVMEKNIGKIVWVDLTVPDAGNIRGFYSQVIGWEPSEVDMGGYEDFNMLDPGGDTPMAGICHQRGPNAELPPVWMDYIEVDDLKCSIEKAVSLGGTILVKPANSAGSAYAVIQDPAGAVCALISNQ